MSIDQQALILQETFTALGWMITNDEYPYVFGKTKGTATTFGEKITIKVEEGSFTIKSSCFIPTQCIDFGKNRYNVNLFMDTFTKIQTKTPLDK